MAEASSLSRRFFNAVMGLGFVGTLGGFAGAALAYAPVLPEKIWKTVFNYGLQSGGAFFSELGLPEKAAHVRIRVRAKTKGSDAQWIFDPGLAE